MDGRGKEEILITLRSEEQEHQAGIALPRHVQHCGVRFEGTATREQRRAVTIQTPAACASGSPRIAARRRRYGEVLNRTSGWSDHLGVWLDPMGVLARRRVVVECCTIKPTSRRSSSARIAPLGGFIEWSCCSRRCVCRGLKSAADVPWGVRGKRRACLTGHHHRCGQRGTATRRLAGYSNARALARVSAGDRSFDGPSNKRMEPSRPAVLCDPVTEARGSFAALARQNRTYELGH